MIGIYMIKNKINKKVYIGQSTNIKDRWKEHKLPKTQKLYAHLPLYKAFKKYGIRNFDIIIIEECDEPFLNEKETYWILYHKSNEKDFGYNLTEGGDNHTVGSNNGRAKLTEGDVRAIREMRLNLIPRMEVYEKFKHIITLNGFLDVWQNRRWKHIIVEGAYSDNVNNYYHSLKGNASVSRFNNSGEKNKNSILKDDEVMEIRKRYVDEDWKSIYEDFKNRASQKTIKNILYGQSYKHLPIYRKKTKTWTK